jgi:hypothetical protein
VLLPVVVLLVPMHFVVLHLEHNLLLLLLVLRLMVLTHRQRLFAVLINLNILLHLLQKVVLVVLWLLKYLLPLCYL